MNVSRLEYILSQFPALTLLVVGDYFLDRYWDIDSALAETSLETGLEVHQVARVRCSPGAAGTVTSNLRTLGVNVIALGVIGIDGEGFELERALAATGVDVASLIESNERFTPTYTKPMRDGKELNRVDLKNRTPMPATLETEIIARLRDALPRVNGVIVVDQVQERNCGVITDRLRESIATLAKNSMCVFTAESRERIGEFRNVILQANLREARRALHSDESAQECGVALHLKTRCPIVLTVGADGILVFDETGNARVPAVPVREPIDTVGAGDSVLAGFTAARCAGASVVESAEVGNLAAAITIRQIGTTGTATPSQMIDVHRRGQYA